MYFRIELTESKVSRLETKLASFVECHRGKINLYNATGIDCSDNPSLRWMAYLKQKKEMNSPLTDLATCAQNHTTLTLLLKNMDVRGVVAATCKGVFSTMQITFRTESCPKHYLILFFRNEDITSSMCWCVTSVGCIN